MKNALPLTPAQKDLQLYGKIWIIHRLGKDFLLRIVHRLSREIAQENDQEVTELDRQLDIDFVYSNNEFPLDQTGLAIMYLHWLVSRKES